MFDEIKSIAPNVCYLNGNGENVPPPPNEDTSSMIFIEENEYTVGFNQLISENDKEKVITLLKYGTLSPEYGILRKAEYPPLEDFVDAYYWQTQGDNELMNKYLQRCKSVKEKYKK
jgi:hypothetical protein